MIYTGISQLIGKTPLMELANFEKEYDLCAKILAKLECFNPAGSVKDRVAVKMLSEAERAGLVTKDTVIIEPTSGNTGIGLACVCAQKGYRIILTMPETMSTERRALLSAYGAQIVLTNGEKGMQGAIEKANELKESFPDSFIPGQFENAANPQAHYESTGPEIWEDTGGQVDIFVAGVGTGGTISGTGKYIKEKNPVAKVVAIEPVDSPVLSGGKAGAHGLQGIGAGFIPDTLDTNIYDEVITVSTNQAYETSRIIAKKEGILVGISSGAALYGAMLLAKREENHGKNIVVLLPDSGERYLSTNMFN